MTTATDAITHITRTNLVPLLLERGFTASGTTYRRASGTATQVVNLQRGSKNSVVAASFHLNGGVYLPELDSVIGLPVAEQPDEPSCHVRMRPNVVVETGQDQYVVNRGADAEAFGEATARDLAALIDALDAFVTPENAVAHLSTRLLAQYERVFGWYLHVGDLDAAREFVEGLQERFGEQERRWTIFAARLDVIAQHVRGDTAWREWIDT